MNARHRLAQALFLAGAIFCVTPWASPPVALFAGLVLALGVGNAFRSHTGKLTKVLLQLSVVGLGFGMNFRQVVDAGRIGLAFTAISILGTLAVGWALGRWLGVGDKVSRLIASGTAICGGSAIAAIAPIVEANEREVAVALGAVFVLNSIALFAFPPLGHALGLTARQFGMWCAIAIHDTSSVVGAASRFGAESLALATTVKLTRALWIVPVALGTAVAVRRRSAKIAFPWFIVAFVGAALVVSRWPQFTAAYAGIVRGARVGLTLTLYLIGASLSRDTLRVVGLRPIVQAVVLWLLIVGVSLAVVRATM